MYYILPLVQVQPSLFCNVGVDTQAGNLVLSQPACCSLLLPGLQRHIIQAMHAQTQQCVHVGGDWGYCCPFIPKQIEVLFRFSPFLLDAPPLLACGFSLELSSSFQFICYNPNPKSKTDKLARLLCACFCHCRNKK